MPSSTKHVRRMARRRRRGLTSNLDPVATKGEPRSPQWWQRGAVFGIFAVISTVLCFNFLSFSNFFSTNSADGLAMRRLSIGGSPVIILNDFLPLELAMRWRDQFQAEWDAKPSGFLLATNNDGSGRSRGGNAKYRSHNRKVQRRRVAEQMLRDGYFSYAKHELSPDHEVLKEIADFMLRNDTRHRIAAALNTTADRLDAAELSDLFATSFGEGDFLSPGHL